MVTRCPHCKTPFEVDECYLGKDVECLSCFRMFAVENSEIASPLRFIPIERTSKKMKRWELAGMILIFLALISFIPAVALGDAWLGGLILGCFTLGLIVVFVVKAIVWWKQG